MTTINFFLTRHGETQWNKIAKLQGQLDSPLTKKGYQQAHAIAQQLNDSNINMIVSSTLARAKATADICQLSLRCSLALVPTLAPTLIPTLAPVLRLNPELIERDFGHWQGRFIEEVKDADNYQSIFHQVNDSAPPHGESGIACMTRLQQALITIASEVAGTHNTEKNLPSLSQRQNQGQHSNILVVTHGDILRCFLSVMVHNFSTHQAINTKNKAFDNGCIFQVSYHIQQQRFALMAVHDISHAKERALIS